MKKDPGKKASGGRPKKRSRAHKCLFCKVQSRDNDASIEDNDASIEHMLQEHPGEFAVYTANASIERDPDEWPDEWQDLQARMRAEQYLLAEKAGADAYPEEAVAAACDTAFAHARRLAESGVVITTTTGETLRPKLPDRTDNPLRDLETLGARIQEEMARRASTLALRLVGRDIELVIYETALGQAPMVKLQRARRRSAEEYAAGVEDKMRAKKSRRLDREALEAHILNGTHEILKAINQPTGDGSWRRVKRLSRDSDGPITIRMNKPPYVDRSALTDWWNKMHDRHIGGAEAEEVTDRDAVRDDIDRAERRSPAAAQGKASDYGLGVKAKGSRTHLKRLPR